MWGLTLLCAALILLMCLQISPTTIGESEQNEPLYKVITHIEAPDFTDYPKK